MENQNNQAPSMKSTDWQAESEKLQKKVGVEWLPVPGSGSEVHCWYVAGNGLQFTAVRYLWNTWDIAMYLYATREEFLTAFAAKEHGANATYFQSRTGETIDEAICRFLSNKDNLSLLDD